MVNNLDFSIDHSNYDNHVFHNQAALGHTQRSTNTPLTQTGQAGQSYITDSFCNTVS